MTPTDVAIYHIGGKIKVQLPSGVIVEDYLDDCRLMESYSYSYYRIRLRKHGYFSVPTGTLFEWRADD